ncbi:dicarboxylate/amino acid:cation symporter [Mesoplasma photuris]|uniref:dicarboxylate/amino acid:cation symporter n=1 Tax=Mesoplasma photuris TaxID=217731 RepID=UPI0004E1C061|nr:dicarboxylate/amino acid:cation symporter [Mesoplasma photuris]
MNTTIFSSIQDTLLKGFVGISTWQSLVAILLFFVIMGGFWYGLRQIKIKFMYRVLIGLAIGLVFGVVIQAIIQFPEGSWFTKGENSPWVEINGKWFDLSGYYMLGTEGNGSVLRLITAADIPNLNSLSQVLDANGNQAFTQENAIVNFEAKEAILWVSEFNNWATLLKQVFINGILLLTIPVVFVAIFRVTSKPGQKGLGRISGKAVALLLINVTIAFAITFWIGYFLNIGKGMEFDNQVTGTWGQEDTKTLPNIIWGYVPSNFIGTLTGTAIIPVMVLGALFGHSVKMVSRKKPEAMLKLRTGMDHGWDIIMSMLMTFMKIMPFAVMSMITTSITSRPIGALASIGLTLGVGYLALIIMLVIMTIQMLVTGINVKTWWKFAIRPLLQGFSTQSSNATLPVTMDTLKRDMRIKDEVVNTVGPLSTTMGLVACAGVQAGLITSLLYTGSAAAAETPLWAFFIIGLVTTVVASLGIAGVPGTATVVTSAVLNGIGFGGYFAPVYAIIGALDGLFDMGRTGTNVTGGVYAATMVANWEGLFEEDTPLLTKKQFQRSVLRNQKINSRSDKREEKMMLRKQKQKEKATSKLAKE